MVSAAIFLGEVAVQNGGGPGEVAGTMRPQVFARELQRAIGGKGLRNFRRDFRPAGVFHRGDIEEDQAGIFRIERRRLCRIQIRPSREHFFQRFANAGPSGRFLTFAVFMASPFARSYPSAPISMIKPWVYTTVDDKVLAPLIGIWDFPRVPKTPPRSLP
jgi:hypothetical protein